MSELSKRYHEIISKLDERISNKDDLMFVKDQISEISVIFIDLIEQMSGIVEERIADIEEGQKQIEDRLVNIESTVNAIHKDIYDENTDSEIICPYCNNEFIAEIGDEIEAEIQCPECHNIIELNLNSDNYENELYGIHNCKGQCGGCGGCGHKDNEDDMWENRLEMAYFFALYVFHIWLFLIRKIV